MATQTPIEITVSKHGEVAVVQMSGHDNRINTIFCKKWLEALDKVESWPDVKALVSTGIGKFYSNGLDLDFLAECSKLEFEEYAPLFSKLMRRLLCFPMVTIAAINGHCYAGGFIIALLHDYRVMNEGRGWMCLNEVDLGLRFPQSMRAIIRLKLKPCIVREAAIYGCRYTASEAFENGIIDAIASDGNVLSKAVCLAAIKTKGRTYGREIVRDMKTDMYHEFICSTDMIQGGIVEKMIQSKL